MANLFGLCILGCEVVLLWKVIMCMCVCGGVQIWVQSSSFLSGTMHILNLWHLSMQTMITEFQRIKVHVACQAFSLSQAIQYVSVPF